MRLTVGVSCQNGLPHLARCLEALPAIVGCAEEVDFILVDAASTDGTLAAMLSFAAGRSDTRVFSMSGVVNASATRNVTLRNARPGAVFLVDGDVAVNRQFVDSALAEFRHDSCDIVFGRLPEVLHDGQHRPYGRTADRYKVHRRGYRESFGGIVLWAPHVLAANVHYDETLRRLEDVALALELSDKYRILGLPVEMGTHYTVDYFHRDRVGEFYRRAYMRPFGRLIRDNVMSPSRIWHLRRGLKGYFVGFGLIALLLASIATGSLTAVAIVVVMIGADVARFAWQHRLNMWIPIRLIGMLHIVSGFVVPERQKLDYRVRQVYPDSTPAQGSAPSLR